MTERIVDSSLIVVPAALLYLLVLLPRVSAVGSGVLSPSLAEMAGLLASDAGATLAWVHFLAFDLFVGRWIYRDALGREIPALIVSPVLVLTLLFGPVGYLCYCTLRPVRSNG